ncbi:hypothetical protein Tco_1508957 [Tanacetum coccineum]
MVFMSSQIPQVQRVWPSDPDWHYRSDCPELKNQNHKNGGTGARGVVHALGGGETNQDHNDMEEDINA